MKLLFISHQLDRSGAPLVLLELIRLCRSCGHDTDVISLQDGVLRQEMEAEGINVRICGGFLGDLQYWCGEFMKYDHVVVNTIVCVEAIHALKYIYVPVTWWIHEYEGWFELYKEVLPDPKELGDNIRIFGVSPVTCRIIDKYGYSNELLPLGIKDRCDIEKADRDEDRIRFICGGTITYVKGQDILINAIQRLPSDIRSSCEFVICGPETQQDKQMSDTLQGFLKDNSDVVYTGGLEREAFIGEIAKSDYVIIPSRREPLPTVAVEAMMLFVPNIISDVCGVTAFLEDDKDAFIVKTGDYEDLSRHIADAVAFRNSEAYSEMARRGRKVYEDIFSYDVFRSRVLELLGAAVTE